MSRIQRSPEVTYRRATRALTLMLLSPILALACEFVVSQEQLPARRRDGPPGSQTLRVDPNNPRYFTDGSGRPILLTGSHTWTNLQDVGDGYPPPAFAYTAYLDFLASHDHNFFRLWAWEQGRWFGPVASDVFWFAPVPFARTGPGTAVDGQLRYDVTQFNQAYFDRLRARVVAAGEHGIYVSVMLFNGWSVTHADLNNPWRGHPFNANNNINGINGDPNGNGNGEETHTLALPEITAIQEAYVRRVIDTVNDLDNVLYEISNESHSGSQNWQYHMIDVIKAYEATLPKQHPVGMTVEWPGGSNAELFSSSADWISLNGSLSQPPVADGRKVILADTDHLCGICGNRGWVWRSFLSGENPIFMDPWGWSVVGTPFDNPTHMSLRENLGYVQDFADRIDLANVVPEPQRASSGYCLANPAGSTPEFLVYFPNGGTVSVDLTDVSGPFQVEWFNPGTNQTIAGGSVSGGTSQSFTAPFSGDPVLYLHR